jgi:hypothetical protein
MKSHKTVAAVVAPSHRSEAIATILIKDKHEFERVFKFLFFVSSKLFQILYSVGLPLHQNKNNENV